MSQSARSPPISTTGQCGAWEYDSTDGEGEEECKGKDCKKLTSHISEFCPKCRERTPYFRVTCPDKLAWLKEFQPKAKKSKAMK